MRLRLETVKRLKQLGAKSKKQEKGPLQAEHAVTTGNSTKAANTVGVEARIPKVKKNILQKPSKPKAKFRKRQIFKSWLPTHLFHAKRAHMTPPKEPLWRMSMPLSPTVKSYRPTHRASTARGAIAWDMSYMSSIGLDGPERSIRGVLRALGVRVEDIKNCADDIETRWTKGTRSWEGWVHKRDCQSEQSIAPVAIIWCAKVQEPDEMETDDSSLTKKPRKDTRKVFIRVHPAGFLQLWEEVLRLAKVQKPAVMVEDLRFEIGSIEITGPSAAEALVGALWPSEADQETVTDGSPGQIWPTLRNLTNPASLPKNVLICFDISDPRLHHPPRKVKNRPNESDHQKLLQTLAAWPLDKSMGPARLFDRSARLTASRELPSQKAINRRKALATPGEYPVPQANDPKIPMLLMISRSPGGNTGTWTILMPWKCVLPVWYSIMYHPLASGGTPRFGGLDEKRQIFFESGSPWFPGDYPGTAAGLAWEHQERAKRKVTWEKRPKGKRTEWDSLTLRKEKRGEIGLGWACDWEHLLKEPTESTSTESMKLRQLPASAASALLAASRSADAIVEAKNGLFTVGIEMISRGVVTNCARVYRLPTADPKLRQQWLSLLPSSETRTIQKGAPPQRLPKDAPPHVRRQYLAVSLLQPARAEGIDYPAVPDEKDLIGFVTTGNYNLGEGKGTSIACLLMSKILYQTPDSDTQASASEERLCVVREAGLAIGRLARWNVV